MQSQTSDILDLHSFSVSAIRALNMGVAISRRAGARVLGSEHLLLALLNQSDGNANKILLHFGIDLHAIRSAVESYLSLPSIAPPANLSFLADGGVKAPLSANLVQVLDQARGVADSYRLAWVGTDHLLAALVTVEGPAAAILRRYGMANDQVQMALRQINGDKSEAGGEGNTSIVVDLVTAAKNPGWMKTLERVEPLRELVNILSQRRRNSAIVIGEPGSGRRSLVASLAQLAARGELPAGLGAGIWALQPGALIANAEGNIELALRVATGGTLLIPDLLLFFGGSAFPGYAEAGMAIRAALTDRRLRVIGTATTQGFNKHLDPDATLTDAAVALRLEPPNGTETVAILDLHRPGLEQEYKVTCPPPALTAAATLARQYLPGALPATALAGLERACVLVQLAGSAAPALRTSGISADLVVDANEVAAAIGAMSGVPIGQLMGPERERLARMEEELHKRVIGQDEAIAAISRAYRRARAGFRDVKRPIGSFLFLGPSGVGKTEAARALAEFLFGTEEAMIRIDMSEYMEKHAVARLVGAPPGYVGYDEGGQLTEAVRRKPSSVVLFDEVEKGHPDVYNLFLQVLDDGWLTDNKGRRVDFRNTIIIMTSNLGTEYILAEGTTHAEEALSQETRERIEGVLRSHFRPEFLNRIDKIVIFTPLSRDQLGQVLDLQLRRIDAMAANAGLRVMVTAAAKDWLLDQNDQPEFGARPIRRIAQDFLQDPLVDGLTAGAFGSGNLVNVDAPPPGGTALVLTVSDDTAASPSPPVIADDSVPRPHTVAPAESDGEEVQAPRQIASEGGQQD